ncbi:MAG: acyltransferase family protein [Ferruginibacter sp.]
MQQKIYFKDLDAIRTIAAMMVFCTHATKLGSLQISNQYLANFLGTFFDGGTGVLIFFVLSGFLITYLILSEVKQKGAFSLRNFYLRRILRIWPLYFTLLIFAYFIYLPILGHYSNINVAEISSHAGYYFGMAGNFDMLRDALHDFIPVGITWSVAIEEQFYLVWPLLFFFIPPKRYQYIFHGSLIISLAFKIYNYDDHRVLYYHSLGVVPYLSIGGLAAYYSINSEKFRNLLNSGNKWFIYVAGLLFLYLRNFATINPIIVTSGEAIFFAWVILDQSHNMTSTLKFSRSGILTKMGKYTYGIYMLHQIVLFSILAILNYLGRNDLATTITINYVIGLPLTLLLAYASYHLLEKRFLILKNRLEYIKTTDVENDGHKVITS